MEYELASSKTHDELLALVKEDPFNLFKYQITDASLWAESLCAVEEGKDYDKQWMIAWFASAIETTKDSINIPDVSPQAEEILAHFPVGTVVESADGTDGGTPVFINNGQVQPFSYLGDYNPEHYRVKEIDNAN